LIWPSDGKDLARSFPLSAAWLGIVELDITLHVYWLIKIFVHPLYVQTSICVHWAPVSVRDIDVVPVHAIADIIAPAIVHVIVCVIVGAVSI
jgi:hypothetical protein